MVNVQELGLACIAGPWVVVLEDWGLWVCLSVLLELLLQAIDRPDVDLLVIASGDEDGISSQGVVASIADASHESRVSIDLKD